MRNVFLTGIMVALTLAAFGCQRTRMASPLPVDHDVADREADMAFWHGLADRPVVTNDEAFHALIAFAEGGDPSEGYADRLRYLKKNALLSERFDRPADEAVSRGTVARILAPLLGIEGGLTMRLIGPTPRVALRELVHRDIMPMSSEQQGLSGIQFVEIISKAEDYLEDR
ncbi:MAG: hypothetical protein ACODAQ_09265 [Phycisphaeraceae bacterium]